MQTAEAILRKAVIENHIVEMERLNEGASPVSFSDAHVKRMNRLFISARVKRFAVRTFVIIRKSVAAASFVIAILSLLLLFNPKVQAAVADAITDIFSGFTGFRFNDSAEEADKHIEWGLRWLPESFVETYREYDAGTSRAGYADSTGVTIRFTANPVGNNSINVDNEKSTYSVITKDGIDYHIYSSVIEEAPSVIIWVHKGYDFIIISYCGIELLERIAYSTYEVAE
jgi:hypothetical protein